MLNKCWKLVRKIVHISEVKIFIWCKEFRAECLNISFLSFGFFPGDFCYKSDSVLFFLLLEVVLQDLFSIDSLFHSGWMWCSCCTKVSFLFVTSVNCHSHSIQLLRFTSAGVIWTIVFKSLLSSSKLFSWFFSLLLRWVWDYFLLHIRAFSCFQE